MFIFLSLQGGVGLTGAQGEQVSSINTISTDRIVHSSIREVTIFYVAIKLWKKMNGVNSNE